MNRVFLTPAAVALCGASSLSLAEPVSLADQVVTATRTAQTASRKEISLCRLLVIPALYYLCRYHTHQGRKKNERH